MRYAIFCNNFKYALPGFLLLAVLFQAYAQPAAGDARKRVSISSKSKVEFSPTISADGRTLIFERQTIDKWELYQSHLDENGQWSEPYPLKSINEKCSFLAGPCLSYDGNKLYYTAFIEGVTKSEDIFYSERLGAQQWSVPKSVGPAINTDSYEGFPSVSSDDNSLYFIGMHEEMQDVKKEKEDCFAIYVSHRSANGEWGEPVLLPDGINQGCERDPKIMADNRTLIFSSIQPNGIGKYDLYQTQMKPDKTWTEPIALDFINSPENDQSPCISASGDKMFFYSDDDIYEIPIPQTYRQFINITVQGTILAEKTNRPVPARITVRNTATNEIFTLHNNGNDGRYSIIVAAGNKYEATYYNEDFFPEVVTLDYTRQASYKEEKKDIVLRSDYTLSLAVIDKDLKTPVTAFITLVEPGVQTIFSDSLRQGVPRSFPLQSTSRYQITAVAAGYPEVKLPWQVDASSSREISQTIELLHAKVKAVADVTEVRTGQKMKMKVTYTNETTKEVIIVNAGEVAYLRKGDRYQVVTNSEAGYAYSITTILAEEPADTGNGATPLTLQLRIVELVEGAKLSLEHIHFKSSSAELNESSTLELKSVVLLLKNNPNIQIEISAHTDNVGHDDYNMNLSQKRAQSVINYLNKNGIPLTQMVARGYGKTHPLVPNDTEENRAMNRRVELLVLDVK